MAGPHSRHDGNGAQAEGVIRFHEGKLADSIVEKHPATLTMGWWNRPGGAVAGGELAPAIVQEARKFREASAAGGAVR